MTSSSVPGERKKSAAHPLMSARGTALLDDLDEVDQEELVAYLTEINVPEGALVMSGRYSREIREAIKEMTRAGMAEKVGALCLEVISTAIKATCFEWAVPHVRLPQLVERFRDEPPPDNQCHAIVRAGLYFDRLDLSRATIDFLEIDLSEKVPTSYLEGAKAFENRHHVMTRLLELGATEDRIIETLMDRYKGSGAWVGGWLACVSESLSPKWEDAIAKAAENPAWRDSIPSGILDRALQRATLRSKRILVPTFSAP